MAQKIDEMLDLIKPLWFENQDKSLLQLLVMLSQEAGFEGQLETIEDDALIYQMKMRKEPDGMMIPGIAKDVYEDDFDWKNAILKARGFDVE